jgi:hypothetical protein
MDENKALNTEEETLIYIRYRQTVRSSCQAQEAAETECLLAQNRANLSVEFHHLVTEVLESALIVKTIRYLISSSIPLSERYEEAINNLIYGKKWREAIRKELEQLRIFETWELVKRSISQAVVTCKWVFLVKFSPDGRPEHFKACLVARGFSQQYGIDYEDTFAPVI